MPTADPATSPGDALRAALERQRAAFAREPMPTPDVRRDRLQRLREMTRRHADEPIAAIASDFGHRAAQETLLTEVFTVPAAARHALQHLRAWSRPRRVPTQLHFLPGRKLLIRQPLGPRARAAGAGR